MYYNLLMHMNLLFLFVFKIAAVLAWLETFANDAGCEQLGGGQGYAN